jgi:transcriptional regulator with XRE-family HTH domain
MSKNSLIKQNILQYIDCKGITKYRFYQLTGITRGFLDSSSGSSEETIAKFITYFKDVNISWLLTGEGNMLKETANKQKLMSKNSLIKQNISYLVQRENKGKDGFGKLFNLNRGTIGTYIDGKALPKIETLQKISEKYNISIDDLVNNLIEKKSPTPTKTSTRLKDPTLEEKSNLIRKIVKEQGIQTAEISRKTGYSEETIKNILIDGKHKSRPGTIIKILEYLQRPTSQLPGAALQKQFTTLERELNPKDIAEFSKLPIEEKLTNLYKKLAAIEIKQAATIKIVSCLGLSELEKKIPSKKPSEAAS